MRKITAAGVRRRAYRYSRVARTTLAQFIEDGTLPGRRNAAAVDFTEWLRRGAGRRSSGHPDTWRIDPQLPLTDPSTVAVVVHVFYPELVDDLLAHLAAFPVGFDLIVTNASGTPVRADRTVAPNVRNIVLLDVENRGRDLFPLVQLVNAGILDPYELVLKLHTKKSAWRDDRPDLPGAGAEWRDGFLEALTGSREQVERILDSFAADPELGLITAPGNLVGPEHWGADQPLVRELLRRLEMDVDPDALRFPAGSMYWVRAFVLHGLRALNMTADDFDTEPTPIDGTTAHALERAIGIVTEEAGLRLADTADTEAPAGGWRRYDADVQHVPGVRMIPFYLPQFHPVRENDVWWGKGFTEWTNVAAAQPVYKGHYQPKLPADLGFYDLRLDAVREAQAELGAAHGLAGFMYYYYWFAGRRLLSQPIERLAGSEIDKPFCIMWANENWTRSWDGRSKDVLIGQDYDTVPAEQFIDDVMDFLRDHRYIRVDGKPLLAVYRPGQMENFADVLAAWRRRAREAGVGELHVLAVSVAERFHGLGQNWREYGLDGTLGFPPHSLPWEPGPADAAKLHPDFRGNFVSYPAMVDAAVRKLRTVEPGEYPGVMVNFDNTARRQWRPDVWYGSNPYTFHRWLMATAMAVMDREPQERLVFINAWNEWAEGAVLEPTSRWGRTYLQACRNVALS